LNLEFGILNPAGQRRRSYETSLEFDVFLWEGQNDRTMKIS